MTITQWIGLLLLAFALQFTPYVVYRWKRARSEWIGNRLYIMSGVAKGQSRKIIAVDKDTITLDCPFNPPISTDTQFNNLAQKWVNKLYKKFENGHKPENDYEKMFFLLWRNR